MKKRKQVPGRSLLVAGLLAAAASGQAQPGPAAGLPRLGKSPLSEVIAAMTLEEKARIVVGNGFHMPGSRPQGGPVVGQTQDKVPGAAGTTFAIPRLGIPSLVVADGPAGLRIQPFRDGDSSQSYYCTAFPVATLLASTWDTALVRQVGVAFGSEVHEYGVDVLLAPALNIHRNPLGGRNFEYYSEDPLVAGRMTSALVNGIQSNGVGTSIKHFVANNQETNRNTVNTIVSERALREIYLKGFEIAVKGSRPWTVMSSYNKLNGTYTSQEYDLLTTILRKEWGFRGLVMTDWFGGVDPVEQMKAGNDLLMPGTTQQTQRILSAVQHDSLDSHVLDENVARILNLILQSPSFRGYKYSNKPDLKKDARVSRTAAADGMVLLRNEGHTLPLSRGMKLALLGNTSYDIIAGGTGSGDVNKAYTVSLLQGLTGAGYTADAGLVRSYTDYLADQKAKRPKPRSFFERPRPIEEMAQGEDQLRQLAASCDAAVLTIGRNAGEGADRQLDNDFYLSQAEKDLIARTAAAFHQQGKKLVVVLNTGGVMEVASWRDQVDAILLAWQPGQEAGHAIADVLSGKVNPSGRLATTFPMDYPDVPSAKNFPGKEFPDQAVTGNFGRKIIPAEVTYEEGIYVGYRYYHSFGVKPAYPFGYGLSYTDFRLSGLHLGSTRFVNTLTVTATVTNTGKVAGREVVQLYLSAPAGELDKPAEELKGFAKTRLLAPGQSEQLRFILTPADLASFASTRSAWVAEAGTYTVRLGFSSEDIRQQASFTLAREKVVEPVNRVLLPQVPIRELHRGE